jgi:L-ascorbate metabolism protein UlaG (beta-lactamase superfamily)
MLNIKIVSRSLTIFSLAFLMACASALPASTPTITLLPPTATPQATATIDPFGLQFTEIPEQTAPQGETFLTMDIYVFLRFRAFPAKEMTWNAAGSEHIAASASNGVITANPIDPAWVGSEILQVEACEPSGTCARQNIIYSVLDKTAFSDVRVTFVGNSGFLITVGDKKVLIDAFFNDFPPEYVHPEYVQNPLLDAEPPFNNVDLILATHDHSDHFMATMVRQHMQNNPNAVFVSTTQSTSQLADFGDRVIAVDPITGTPVQVEANGIQVEAIYLSHGYPPNDPNEVFNNSYVVTINEIKFFHTGDLADLNDALPYNLADMNIDLAFIQHFYLQNDSAEGVLRDGIGAKYLLPIHYIFTQPALNIELIKSNYPGAIIFSKELESWFMPLSEN